MLQIWSKVRKFGAYWGHCFRNIQYDQFILFLNLKTSYPPMHINISPGAPKSGAPAAAPLPPRLEADSRTDPSAPLCHSLAVPDLPPGYAGNFRQTFSQLCSLEAGELIALLCGSAVDHCRSC